MAIDWEQGMRQTYQMTRVDPSTWLDVEVVQDVMSGKVSIENDGNMLAVSTETLETLDETYYRIYLLAEQSGESERVALATFLVQKPKGDTEGLVWNRQATGYSGLKELDANMPPIGWSWTGTVLSAIDEALSHTRAPHQMTATSDATVTGWAVDDQSWLSTLSDLLDLASAQIDLMGDGTIVVEDARDVSELSPVYTYADGSTSIIEPSMSYESDRSSAPNVVQVVWTSDDQTLVGTAVNDDPNSPLSTTSRGYTVLERVDDADLPDSPTQADLDAAAATLLAEKSMVTTERVYSHAYMPQVRVGKCVACELSGLGNLGRGIVQTQDFDLETGLTVDETVKWEEEL